jgi:hypothetical protein
MNTKENEVLENYFKTENEHWNTYSFETIRKAIETQIFANLITLMQLYENSISIASETHKDKPFDALQVIITEYDNCKLSIEQKVFLFERVFKYLDRTEFEGWYSSEIQSLLKSQINAYQKELSKKPDYNKPLTGNIRDTLKEMMQKELEQLPETLKDLEPVQRLNILCKLIPYVLPKVESVTHKLGEPDEFKVITWHE